MPPAAADTAQVSVIVPTRDRPDLLARAVGSVLAQRDVAVEVIVVDDGSRVPAAVPDGVRLVRHERSVGVSQTRNVGLREARAAWVAFLDDDDFWAPDKLSRQLAAAADAEAEMAFSAAVRVDPEGEALFGIAVPDAAQDLWKLLLRANVVPAPSSNTIVRTEVMRELGGFDPAFSAIADWDMHIRLAARCRVASVEDPLVAYTLHPGAMTNSDGGARAELGRLRSKHPGLSPSREDWLTWRVGILLHGQCFRHAALPYLQLGLLRRDPRAVARAALLAALGSRGGPRLPPPPPVETRRWVA